MTECTVLGLPFVIHDREEWQVPSRPITGPSPSPELVHWGICHYPGAGSTWVPPSDVPAHLRWANDLYLNDPNRGYSYGYGFVIGPNPVDWLRRPVIFDTWEVRGFDIRIASNNGDFPPWSEFHDPNFNGRSLSVQIMCSDSHPPTADQRMQFRYMMALCDLVYGEMVTVQPHRASDSTDCPGPCMPFMTELATRPNPLTPDDPNPTPPQETDTMAPRVAKLANPDGSTGAFYIGDGNRSRVVGDGGDISTDESLLRMATGAVNAVRVVWDQATDDNAGPAVVTRWEQIKTPMRKVQLRRYVGVHESLKE